MPIVTTENPKISINPIIISINDNDPNLGAYDFYTDNSKLENNVDTNAVNGIYNESINVDEYLNNQKQTLIKSTIFIYFNLCFLFIALLILFYLHYTLFFFENNKSIIIKKVAGYYLIHIYFELILEKLVFYLIVLSFIIFFKLNIIPIILVLTSDLIIFKYVIWNNKNLQNQLLKE